ncbi:2-dehydro-3-deoxy-D-gluconate 5-dehydrogenase KduD [Rhodococcus baikonurensis]
MIDEIAERGGDSAHVELDLASKDEAIRQAADAAIANYGRVDILVNCAGLVVRKPIVDQSSDEIENLLHIDLTAPLLLARAFAPHMIARGSGRVLNIASLMSFQGGVNVAGYAAAKSGLAGVTKALTNEWAGQGITVNAIAPGYIATEINVDLRNDESRRSEFLQRIPAGRWGDPQDLVGAAVFLSSAASRYVSGQILAVDGDGSLAS